jgi:CBS domain-containing protein
VIAAGPLVTAALVVLFGATQQLGQALGWPRAVVDVAGLLTLLQVMLLLFDLAPAFPLDGGQMLRAWLWRRSGGAHRGARGRRAFPVTREGELVGYTSIGLASQVARERNGATVSEAMVPRDQAAVQLDANTPLEEALEKVPDVADRAIVVEDGLVTGIVLRRAIAQALLETAEAKRERRELAGLGW